jgi:hypothetical protein
MVSPLIAPKGSAIWTFGEGHFGAICDLYPKKGKGPTALAQGFQSLIFCTHPGRTVETWKTPLDGTKEHRLETYACYIVFRIVERSLRATPEAVAVHPQRNR